MTDLTSYPPEFNALLEIYNQEILGVMDRIEWAQEARKAISRYALAASVMTENGLTLAPVLRDAFLQMMGITSVIACSGEFTPELKGRVQGIGQAAIERIGAELKDAETYTRQLTNNVHALYSRAMNRQAFFRDTGRIIETQLNEAWLSGADEMMVLPEDMTDADKAYIKKLITAERDFLDGFADDIQDAAGDQAGWQKFQPRISMWVNRLNDVESQARLYFANEKDKFEWVLGPTEEHCHKKDGKWGCAELAGTVANKTQWDEAGVHPQGTMLVCNGKHCLCRFVPTRKRRTRGGIRHP